MTTTVFFDLDGTLADTDADIRLSWKAAMSDLGLDCPRFDEVFVAGPSIEDMTRTLFPDKFTPALAADIREGFGRHYDGDGFPLTREYPGVIDVVRKLKQEGKRVFIATNKRYIGAKLIAAHFGWDGIFDGLYAGDMHMHDEIGKLAKSELLALALRETGASPGECVMVGDTSSDFKAAAANSMRSIGVSWGYGTPEELAAASAIVDSPTALLNELLLRQ